MAGTVAVDTAVGATAVAGGMAVAATAGAVAAAGTATGIRPSPLAITTAGTERTEVTEGTAATRTVTVMATAIRMATAIPMGTATLTRPTATAITVTPQAMVIRRATDTPAIMAITAGTRQRVPQSAEWLERRLEPRLQTADVTMTPLPVQPSAGWSAQSLAGLPRPTA